MIAPSSHRARIFELTSNVFVLVPLATGCFGGDGPSDTCAGADCPAADASNPGVDASRAVDAAMATRTARIDIELELPLFQGSPDMLIRGGFVAEPDPDCTPQIVGECVVTDCTQADDATYAAPGRLRFSPALGGDIAFDPGPFRIFFSADFVPWAANESFEISGAGEDVDAFAMTATSPRTLDIGEDREIFGLPLQKSQGLAARWVPLSEQVLLRLRQGRDTASGEYEILVECVVSGSSGEGSVPAAALTHLLPDAAGGLGATLDTFAIRQSTTIAGDYAITARVLRSFGQTLFYDVL